MSVTEARYRLRTLQKRYLLLRIVEITLWAAASFFIVFALTELITDESPWKWIPALAIAAIVVTVLSIRYKIFFLRPETFITYLNRTYPTLEESADLFLRESTILTRLEQLQLKKTLNRFDGLYPQIKLPHQLVRTTIVCVLGVGFYVALTSFVPPSVRKAIHSTDSPSELEIFMKANPEIESLEIQVSPPAYTGLKSFQAKGPQLEVPEGSRIGWSLDFSTDIESASVLLSGKDSLVLTSEKDNRYRASYVAEESGFYQISWRGNQKTAQSDYYKITLIKDEAPKLTVDNLNQFTKLSLQDNMRIPVAATLTDDYALTDASIIATVSKGSGESVKFREETLKFQKPTQITGKKVQASLTLDLKKLGLDPGDELYFYVQAWDNKTPTRNYTRTETYFIVLQDTSTLTLSEDEGLGADLMPEYFRSQRQIIIDSEKLLRDRKKLAKQQFNAASNELGYDQKVLRLRYGQFLGEEFEDQIGKVEVVLDDHDHDEKTEDVAKRFGHMHDKENEHNLVAEKKPAPHAHTHEGGVKDPNQKEDPLAAFAHNHDDGEQATFFIESVRAKLKAALTVMWDAELHLRLFDPEKSLPYQYTALKLLKEISNDSRIYVHRTGFDPPPLKEEKRLSGDLSEVRAATVKNENRKEDAFPNVRQALSLAEKKLGALSTLLTETEKQLVNRAGQEVAGVALEQPQYLEGLSLLKMWTDGTISEENKRGILMKIRKVFWEVLPKEAVSPAQQPALMHQLDQQFLNSLEALPYE